jgi:hypothetical protein
MRLAYKQMEHWPALAWIARVEAETDVVQIWHGRRVETRNEWFCEAVWAGEFSSADFDLTERIFGSGARLRGGRIIFVSSGSTLDRLISIETPQGIFVSNSLPCLMNRVGASVDPTSGAYRDFFGGICQGIDKYPRELSTSAGPVRFIYFRNIVWDGATLQEREKPTRAVPSMLSMTIARFFKQPSTQSRRISHRHCGSSR